MKNKTSKYLQLFLIVIVCMSSCTTKAQLKSTDIKTISGKKYYIHKVEKGQSLYAIAKVYNLDVNKILAENDDAIDGIKTGQELKIPIETIAITPVVSIDTNKYVYHKVLKGETIYAITKKYNLTDKQLTSYNPQLVNGLKDGDFVVVAIKKAKNNSAIPTLTSASNATVIGLVTNQQHSTSSVSSNQLSNTQAVNLQIVIDSIINLKPKKNTYEIGLFLPFKFAETDLINLDELSRNKSNFPQQQALAIDFYLGFKKAVDSLSGSGFEINLTIFDTDDKDSLKLETQCKSALFKKLDAIFGPIYSNAFKTVSSYAHANTIPIISPVIQQNKILYNNPICSKVTPSVYTMIEALADYCADSLLTNSNFILVNTTTKDLQYTTAFKNRFNDNVLKRNKTNKDTINVVKGIAGVKTLLSATKKNVVIALTNNPVYLQDFITQLAMQGTKNNITLFGFSNTANIDNLDQEYLNQLNFHFASSNHIDYNEPQIIQLTKQYQTLNSIDPSEYYFEGFDIANYYLSNLKNVGPSLFLNLNKFNANGTSISFKFYKPDAETGFENKAVTLYKYANYKLQKLGWK